MINKILETLYSKVFINIIVKNEQSVVYVEVCSGADVTSRVEKTFDTTSINSKMYEFVNAYKKESPYYYISVLDKSPSQGAIPTCTSTQMAKYVNMSSAKYICHASNTWATYTQDYDLNALVNDYKSLGIDFVFSPFIVMSRFFEDKINSTLSMFILVEENHLSLGIFDNSKLLYGDHLNMGYEQNEEDMLIESSIDDDALLEIDDIDIDEIDIDEESESLNDFSNIEDLDIIDDIDEFSEAQDIQEIVQEKDDSLSTEGFNEDYKRFSLIQNSLGVFYKDEKYESKFIETVYIADAVGVSKDLKGYLEEEMFLNVYIRKINLSSELSELAKAELK
ncbi:MAG: hypothetical protein OQK48_04265 [Sulfurimonas sp.]|uniref:hypothetical protein n=1 Tax=Sulfurimonas sp. TaxID=2022749 RepID=UPI00260DAE53|nr:hypothetical protein [Sulfurimonas sp.]MCW8895799.1 hypothetical protein [Sulfurimonas sp.]MCW8954135.1 hypothetical protein [Sulfurimonas sp.]MCW9068045.1 hypothetical protein [Sulfurimonas sp.]